MRVLLCLLSVAALTNFTGCDPATVIGPTLNRADPENLRLTYGEGICFGECEVYTLEVYSNGLLVRKGERFTNMPGTWHKSLDRRTVTSFLDSLNGINWKRYPTVFPSRLPDAPSTTITWYDGAQQSTTLSFKEETSPEIRQIANRLKQWASLDGYRQISETLGDGKPAIARNEREELIVNLKPNIEAERWVIKYGKQDVQLKERISPSGNYYLITSNPNRMAASELLKFMRQDADVVSAQMNQSVQFRVEE